MYAKYAARLKSAQLSSITSDSNKINDKPITSILTSEFWDNFHNDNVAAYNKISAARDSFIRKISELYLEKID